MGMKTDKPQKIYVISEGSGQTKIGISWNPKIRLSQLQRERGCHLTLEYTRDLPKGVEERIEETAQSHVTKYRVKGDWFLVSVDAAILAVDSGIEDFHLEESIKAVLWTYKTTPKPDSDAELFRTVMHWFNFDADRISGLFGIPQADAKTMLDPAWMGRVPGPLRAIADLLWENPWLATWFVNRWRLSAGRSVALRYEMAMTVYKVA
jgi:hypothetical protein